MRMVTGKFVYYIVENARLERIPRQPQAAKHVPAPVKLPFWVSFEIEALFLPVWAPSETVLPSSGTVISTLSL